MLKSNWAKVAFGLLLFIPVLFFGFFSAAKPVSRVATFVEAETTSSASLHLSSSQQKNDDTLTAYARKAKARGEDKVLIPTPIYEYAGVTGLEEARTYTHIALARVVEARSYVNGPRAILTWYRFKVVEDFSRDNVYLCSKCASSPDPPSEMSPVKQNEILIPRAGGSVTIDGVQVTSEETDFPQFSKSQMYLLFFGLDESRRVAMLTLGPQGVYEIDGASNLREINKQQSFLKKELREHYKNSVDQLKKKLKPNQGTNVNPDLP